MKQELKNAYEKISTGTELRAGLIEIKNLLKEEKNRRELAYQLGGDFKVLTRCLSDGDPKVRKNAALVLGAMESDDLVRVLLNAYKKEDTLFVKSAYLKALLNLNYEEELPYLKERLQELDQEPVTEANQKHIREEAGMLQQLISQKEKRKKHTFDGFDRQVEVILLTNREQREATRNQLKEEKVTMLAGGMRFFTCDLEAILPIRTWRELLFPVKGLKTVSGTPENVASQLASPVLEQLKSLHTGGGAFYFRTELKSPTAPEKKASWVKVFSAALEKASGRELVNSTSDYEVELRLIEGKNGGFVPLLKLFTLKDGRFSYRKESYAAAMAPVQAALLMELARPWFVEGAQVLDPFCGVGTLLVERVKAGSADPLYGLDINEEAVLKARVNAEAAGITIHYINRDVRDFRHEYLFDEIISDLPLTGRSRNLLELKELYQAFFARVPELLKKGGRLFLYTSEENAFHSAFRESNGLKLLKSFLIQEKTGSRLYILEYEG